MPDRPAAGATATASPPLTGPAADSGPLGVSILVRSMARPSLARALASVQAQTYRPLEVIVVNATGSNHPVLPVLEDGVRYTLVDSDRPLQRAEAANRALAAAAGHWLMFLDDDDTLDPHHVERLVQALRQQPGLRVAHAGVRLVGADGTDQGSLDEPVDATRLWSANRLAIHAVLFERSPVDAGLRFDESMDTYEDWDFWFRLARQERFLHVPGVSATYCLVGDSGTSEPHDAARSRRLREPFYRKWLPQLSVAELEALAAAAENARSDRAAALWQLHLARTRVDAQQVRIDELAHTLDAERLRVTTEAAVLQQTRATVTALQRELDDQRDASTRHAQDLREVRAELQVARQDHAHLAQTYAQLEQGYRAVTGSLSWRLTRPLRTLRGLFDRNHALRPAHRVWRALPLSNDQRLALRDAVLRQPWGQRLVRRLAPHLLPGPVGDLAPAAPPTDKERVRADAEAALTDFLATDARIALGGGADEPDVSVIVVLFNQAGLSRLCLQSLAASQGVRFEALVVDNGSSDRVPQLLDRVDGATVLRPGQNLGFLLAVNQAAALARGRYLVLLNNDAMLEPDTLRHAVARLDGDPGAGAVGGPILLWDGHLQEAGSIVWRDGSCQGYGRGDDPARPEYAFVRDVDYCSGAFLMLRRSLFEALGGLDTAFVPAYYEESDLCVRLWEHGHRIVYDPRVRIRHFEFASEVAAGWAIDLQRRHQALFVERHPAFLAAQPMASPQAQLRARSRVPAGRQRVLVIDDRVPLPWLGQGYPRAALMVTALAKAGHAVTHYPLQFPGETEADVRRAVPETVEVMLDHGLPGLAPFLQARQGLYDTVIVSRPHNMQALRRLLDRTPDLLGGARLVYDAEAMFSLRDIARAALDGRPLAAAEQRSRVAAELALAEGAHAVVAVSDAEAQHYRSAAYAAVHVLGHEVQVERQTPGFDARSGFLFVGAMTADDTPNADSLRWFVREVWPRVCAALGPGVCLHLVGQCDAPSVRALAGPRVIVHGRVESVKAPMDRARVFIVPTRFAAGIPHKAHEAAARGLPMVVTGLIAEQLGWQHFVATGSRAADFAEHCVALYQDHALWQAQRQALLDAVANDCSPAAFQAGIERLMVDAGASGRSPSLAHKPAAA